MDIEDPVSLRPIKDYIDNQVVVPMVKLSASISNPNTNEPLQQQRATGVGHLNQALASATRVHETGEWRSMPPAERIALLNQIAERLEPEIENIAVAESLTTGVVINHARRLTRHIPQIFRQAAAHMAQAIQPVTLSDNLTMRRRPWGPAVLITPCSGGAAIAAHKVASALVAGCPVILKPSEWAPQPCEFLADAISEVGLPTGVFQLVHGGEDVGRLLVDDVRIRAVSFTGSTHTGREVALTCATDFKPLQLELGGVNPLIVLEDADTEAAAEVIVRSITAFNGQWCRAGGRLLLHRQQYNDVMRLVLEHLEKLPIGDSLLPESAMGPVIHDEHRQAITQQIEILLASGGIAYQAGRLPDLPGYFMQPTLIAHPALDADVDEIPGPVVTVHLFRDENEAVSLANQPRSAQVATIFTQDQALAHQISDRLNISSIRVNDLDLYDYYPAVPRSGWGLSGAQEAGLTQSISLLQRHPDYRPLSRRRVVLANCGIIGSHSPSSVRTPPMSPGVSQHSRAPMSAIWPIILAGAILLVSACGALSQPTPTLTPVPTSTSTPIPPTATDTPTPTETLTPTITATPEIHDEDLVGEGIAPPLDIDLPEDWAEPRYLAVALPDVDSALRLVYVTAYEGPVTGGKGRIVVLWGFPNIFTGSLATLPGTPTPAPDLYVDGLRLFRTAMVETGCNAGTDVQRDFPIGDRSGSGTYFAIVDCPKSADTRGWFAGLQEQGLNFVFFIYVEPIEAINGASGDLQAILDSVRFHVEDFDPGE